MLCAGSTDCWFNGGSSTDVMCMHIVIGFSEPYVRGTDFFVLEVNIIDYYTLFLIFSCGV